MKNSSGMDPWRKCLECEFPPCNCTKCIKLRSEGKPDQQSLRPRCKGGDTANNTSPQGGDVVGDKDSSSKAFPGFGNMNIPKFSFTPSNLSSMLFDIVGILAFFMMATFMFWITVCSYLWRSLTYVYQSGRKAHIAAIVILILLVLCTTFHAIRGGRSHSSKQSSTLASHAKNETISGKQGSKCQAQGHSWPCNKKKCSQQRTNNQAPPTSAKVSKTGTATDPNNNSKSQPGKCGKCGRTKPKRNPKPATNPSKKSNTPSLCDLCANEKKATPPTHKPVLSDEEIREMYKLAKLYAMPTEMKTPPPSLVHIIDYLSNYYFGTTGSTGNTLPPITV